jgi:RNA ligase
VKLTELFSLEELELELQDGYVKEQKHPTLPLTILNYTDKTTYDRRWNDVTMHCRGLIVNRVTQEVVARGPRKFFNYGEPSATTYPLDTKVLLSRKEDGSLGIGWFYEDPENEGYAEGWHWGIATRGSFTSEQATHATELVKANSGRDAHYELMQDALDDYAADNISYIGEIVYPENRIVLDYAGRDEVIPLGTVNNRTGVIQWRPTIGRDGYPIITHSDFAPDEVITLAEALALEIPDNEEGYVLDILDDDLEVIDHLKLKGDRYKELHAAIFGLSAKAIWEQCQNRTISAFIESLPDEVQPWAEQQWSDLNRAFDVLWFRTEYARIAVRDYGGETRREQAQYIMQHYADVAPALFALLDNNYVKRTEWIWKQIKPGHVPFSATKTLESASI